MAATRRGRRGIGGLIFCTALLAPDLVYAAAPAVPPPLPAPTGLVVNVSSEPQLQAAVASLQSNETIVLAPGVYRLSSTLWITRALTQVVIRGATNNRDDVVIAGPGMTHASYGLTPHAIWAGGVQGITIANLTIRDVYQDGIVFAPGTDKPLIHNVRIVDAGRSFIESTAAAAGAGVNDGRVEYSMFEYSSTARDPGAVGVSVQGGARWTFSNNVFRNLVASSYQLAGPAILMSQSASDTVVDGNSFINCSRGVSFGRAEVDRGDHAGGVVRNNMFFRAGGQPGDTAIAVNGSPNTQVVNNSVFVSGTYAAPIEYRYEASHDLLIANNIVDGGIRARDGATGLEAANLTSAGSELFANAAYGDLHLSAAATAAVDRGVAIPSVTTDWDGDARPQGAGWDIGADERASGTVASGSPAASSFASPAGSTPTAVPAAMRGSTAPAATKDAAPSSTTWTLQAATAAAETSLAGARGVVAGGKSDTPAFIGGRVTAPNPDGVTEGTGVAGVTVTLTGGRNLTVTTDATGIYLFGGVSLGADYTITPSKPGVVFTPSSFVITALNGTITNANFSTAQAQDDLIVIVPNPNDSTTPGADPPPSGSIFDPAPPDDPDPDPDNEPAPDPAPAPEPPPTPPGGGGSTPPAPIPPPSVRLTAPLTGTTFSAPATITISASASTTTGSISRVDFYIGATKLASDTRSPYRVGWTNVAAGTYAVKAIATSTAGVSAESTPATITVSDPVAPPPAVPPTVTLTAPASNQTYTAPATITMSASASATNGSITKVEFYAGSTLIGTDTTSPYSRSWTNVAAGTYVLKAVATDSNGVSATSGTTTVIVNPAATVPPTITLTSPASGSAYTAPASITVSANASTPNGSITKVEFFAGTTLIGTDTSAPYSIAWSASAAGSYGITAKATDSVGASKTSSAVSVTVTAPLSAPTVSLTSPANGSVFTSPASITLGANATTASGTITRVDFYAGSTLIGTDTSAPYTATWNGVAAGSYSLLAVATSSVGLSSQSSAISVTVASPSTPPTVSLTSPASGSTFTSPATITVNASATTLSGSITSVQFYANSTLIGTDTSSPYSVSWSSVSAGTYSLTARATNSAGLSATSSAVSVTVSDPVGGGGTGGGGGSGGGSSSGAALLDDFSSGIRQTSSGDDVWQHYPEGATGSVSVSGGILTESVGGVTDGNGGGVYLEFYPKGNAGYTYPTGYTQNWIKSGTWNAQFNRLTFRVKVNSTIARGSDGSALFEVGTYIRDHNNGDQSWQGDHYYHRLSPNMPANHWVYITINRVPQHQVGDNGVTNYPENPDGVPYFDGLTRFYFDGIYATGANMTWQYDDFVFSQVGGEPDTLVASTTGTYTGSRYEVSWQTPKNSSQQYTVHYSTSSMKTNGFASGTNGGTVSATGNTYTGAFWASPNMSQSAGGIYIAIQPVGQSAFTEIYIPNS